ncbi:MAG: symmetrical bis(5'-nucleosyl)-tetraphosphatase [Undibacterium sp.]|nr:symmetrical bis(5'-nucleosyl)-tetraphosphatase [Undibacterium sp.]
MKVELNNSPDTFVIGDVQGCYQELCLLLEKIDVIAPQARLIFAGDLVNRGPKSLATLRLIKQLGSRANSVLGNHDLHLLAVAYGIRDAHASDTLSEILEAPDREELLTWLRQRPLAIAVDDHLIVHAGVSPQWTRAQTLILAQEIETALRGANWLDLLRNMYGNSPVHWNDQWQGIERQRYIINALTRIRYCHPDGSMDFDIKEGTALAPAHLLPWFDLTQRPSQDTTVVFGHWSTLGLVLRQNIICLDTGCVWGGKLSAIRLRDRLILQVDSIAGSA